MIIENIPASFSSSDTGTNMDDNLIEFPGTTYIDLPPEKVLSKLLENADELESAVVIGQRKDGSSYFVTSITDVASILWLLEATKFELMDYSRKDD